MNGNPADLKWEGLRIFSCIIESLKIWLEFHSLHEVKTKDHISKCTSFHAALYPQSSINKSASESLTNPFSKIKETAHLGSKIFLM